MKTSKNLIVAGLVGATALVSAPAMAGSLSGNAGVMSQYLFRGLEQSDSPAVYGGFDYGLDNGLYVGTWAATVDFGGTPDGDGGSTGAELDLYVGYAGGDVITYDIGMLYYWYMEEDEAANADPTNNTFEFYGSVGYNVFGLSVYYAPDTYFAAVNPDGSDAEGAYGVYATVNQPLTDLLTLDLLVGYNGGEGNEAYANDSSGYMLYSLGVSAALDNGFGMSFGLVMTDRDNVQGGAGDDDPKLIVDASYSFDL